MRYVILGNIGVAIINLYFFLARFMNYQDPQQKYQEDLKKFITIIKQQILNPDILIFEKQLYTEIFKLVKQQEQRIKSFILPQNDTGDSTAHAKNLKQQIYRCETEKVQYLLKEYLRIRLKKIEKYCFYLIKNDGQARKKLSENEYTFLKSYAAMKFGYFEDVVLKQLTKAYRGFGGIEVFLSKPGQLKGQIKNQIDTKQSRVQIPQPPTNNYVFCQITGNPDLYKFNLDIPISNVEDKSVIPISSIMYTQYKYVSTYINEQNAELL